MYGKCIAIFIWGRVDLTVKTLEKTLEKTLDNLGQDSTNPKWNGRGDLDPPAKT